jgi:hypothetical protein
VGLDYIRSKTGKPWKKRWNGGLDKLKAPTLFELNISETERVVTAKLAPNTVVCTGDTFIVEISENGSLTIGDGLRAVGTIQNPSPALVSSVQDCGGYAEGTIDRVGTFGDTADVKIK